MIYLGIFIAVSLQKRSSHADQLHVHGHHKLAKRMHGMLTNKTSEHIEFKVYTGAAEGT